SFPRFGAITLSLHPAGHVLGSAQVRLAHDDGRVWVVTDDYKRDPDPTCAPFEVIPCDTCNTVEKFGPVRPLKPQQVLEIASKAFSHPRDTSPASPCVFRALCAGGRTSRSRRPTPSTRSGSSCASMAVDTGVDGLQAIEDWFARQGWQPAGWPMRGWPRCWPGDWVSCSRLPFPCRSTTTGWNCSPLPSRPSLPRRRGARCSAPTRCLSTCLPR